MNTDITLPADLSIYSVASTRQAWLATLAAPAAANLGALRVDASSVSEIDGAGLQLLLSLQRSMAAQRRSLCLVQPSRALRVACSRAGLGPTLLLEHDA